MKEDKEPVGNDEKEEFGGLTALKPAIIRPIKCRECNKVMQPQVNDLEYILHCQPCRRAVVISDWNTNSEFFGK